MDHNKKTVLLQEESPPVAEQFLRRPAVERKLQNAFKKPLVTVIAGAGYGKTQAVLSALQSTEYLAAWVQISELDNHVARFYNRVAVAMLPWSQKLFDGMVSIGFPADIAPFDQFLRLLESELALRGRFVLVLDDFHLIHNKSILDFVSLFVSARVYNFSIVLISRKRPDIGLSGMFSKGLLARIDEDDLRFTRDEMEEYLSQAGIELDENALSDIYSVTDGWIFAIYLVGLATQKSNAVNPVFPAKLDIFELIEREIFSVSSKKLQDLLIRAAIPDTVPIEILKQLAGNDLSLISEISSLSSFIRYDPFSDSYRIHTLFREFLLERTSRLSKRDIFITHKIAADWYAGDNNISDAIYHYKEIGVYNEIFELIISIPGRVPREAAETIVELIEQAPEDAVRALPVIRVVKAGYMFNNNRIEDAKRELSRMREEYERLPGTPENRRILGEVYLLLAVIGLMSSDYEFEPLFIEADKLLPEGSKLVDYRTGLAEGVNACSINRPDAGELNRYRDALLRAAPHASRVMNGCGYGLEYLNIAESGLYTGDLKIAEKNAYEAIQRSRLYLQYDIEFMANFVLVRIFTAKGDYTGATGVIDRMQEQLKTLQHADCGYLYMMISGWFYTKLGKTHKVAEWIRRDKETGDKTAPVVIGREYLVRSDCLMTEERYYELLALMEQTDKMYEERGILFAVIQNKITKAIVHHYIGDQTESIRFLNEAYELSNPNDLVMQYIEYGNRMRTLIHSARQNESCAIPKEWLNKIYTKSSSYAKMLAQLISAYDAANAEKDQDRINLSKRESEVLAYLNMGMTRKEIAASCYVSLSTVNSVLKNIYNKLGAVNAADAVRIAKEKELA